MRREEAAHVLELALARELDEAVTRQRLTNGELSIDIYQMRAAVAERGLPYVDESNE